jgi:hypothetical protein
MNTDTKTGASLIDKKVDVKVKLSALWTAVMLYMVFIDVLGLYIPGAQEEVLKTAGATPVTQLMLAAAVMLAAPIAMIFFSRVLDRRINRWANIIVGVMTIVFVVGGGTAQPHYLFLGALETFAMLYIIWLAWTWPKTAS